MNGSQSFEQQLNQLIIVKEDFYLTIKCFLPLHIVSIIYMVIMCVSLFKNRYLQRRPKILLFMTCICFTLSALTNISKDISYILMRNLPISVQTCSVIRNFVFNPMVAQGFTDAIDRTCVIYNRGIIPLKYLVCLNIMFPLIGVLGNVYDSFITTDFVLTDDACPITRRSAWIHDAMFLMIWCTTAPSIYLYYLVYKKLSKHMATVTSSHNKRIMSQDRYYRDKGIVRMFFIASTIPVFNFVPLLVVFIAGLFVQVNQILMIIAWILLDSMVPMVWILQMVYIPQIAKGVKDLFSFTSVNSNMNPINISTLVHRLPRTSIDTRSSPL